MPCLLTIVERARQNFPLLFIIHYSMLWYSMLYLRARFTNNNFPIQPTASWILRFSIRRWPGGIWLSRERYHPQAAGSVLYFVRRRCLLRRPEGRECSYNYSMFAYCSILILSVEFPWQVDKCQSDRVGYTSRTVPCLVKAVFIGLHRYCTYGHNQTSLWFPW